MNGLKLDQLILEQKKREEVIEERKDKFIKDMSDDELDDMLQQLMEERQERKRKNKAIWKCNGIENCIINYFVL